MLHPNANFIITELINLRKERGWSRFKCASEIGTNLTTLQHWEERHTQPNASNLCRWAEAFGYELDLHLKPMSEQ